MTLSEWGSVASIVGSVISFAGLFFALLQLSRLRGETRAAKEAAEAAQRLLRRETTNADIIQLNERLQRLIEIHRTGDRSRALDQYPEVMGSFRDIRRNHPNLTDELRARVLESLNQVGEMQVQVEALTEERIPREIWASLNSDLLSLQSFVTIELEDELRSLQLGAVEHDRI